jgi:hypothetical protein
MLFVAGSNSTNYSNLYFDATADRIEFYNLIASANSGYYLTTGQSFRDPSAWYHIVLSVDTTASAGSRVKLYINGSQVSLTINTELGSSADTWMNSATQHYIGKDASGASQYYDGYITEINFIDGQALTPSSFGETDSITGRWKAKAYGGTYGTNGFYLKFADNSDVTSTTLGKDSSPNGNNWTPNNFSVTAGTGNDSFVDSPTDYGLSDTGVGGEIRGNYATLNPISQYASTLSNGNLDFSTSTVYGQSMASIAVSSGKWYWEFTVGGPGYLIGIAKSNQTTPISWGISKTWYSADGNFQDGSTGLGTPGITFTTGDILGFALDLSAGTLKGYKNGTLAGTIASSLTGSWHPGFYGNDGGPGARTGSFNFGQRPFAYTAPSGHKALCTQNLSDPAIKKANSYFDVVTYTGNNSTNVISGLNFQPKILWIKSRSSVVPHTLNDSVRGAGYDLYSNLTNAEAYSALVTSFNSNGFSLGADGGGATNGNGLTYVGWTWNEAPISGVDIVGYVGDGNSGRTISHNLGVAPKLIIVKNRTTVSDWPVYHSSLSASNIVFLGLTQAQAAISTLAWGGVSSASSTTFTVTVGNVDIRNVNKLNDNYVAYCFTEIDGFSKIGSYAGNGSSDGPFVWCGFRPKYVLIKRADSTGNWYIYDSARQTYNVMNLELYTDTGTAETNGGDTIDFVSNGFKIRLGSNAAKNANGGTFIFAAFAESPFKYARAR